MNIGIHSETGVLKKVIVHTPGHEVSLVNPELKDELLFDDIIFEEDARQEHLDMLKIFKAAMPEDGEIFEITDLALETFINENARSFFIDLLIEALPDENIHVISRQLMELPPDELLRFVVEGRLTSESVFTLHPAPNLLFTRDLAAVAGSSVIVSRAAKKARIRESLLMEMLVEFHPLFDSVRDNAVRLTGHQSIEGGDVLVVNEKLVLIGMSERTNFSGLMTAATHLLNNGIEHVLAVDIPKQRSSMHLDTIFTFADQNECVVFPPAILEQKDNIIVLSKKGDHIVSEMMPDLKIALEELTGNPYNFINCGGDDRTAQFREQWTDGANVFALAPGVIVGYERNSKTFNTLVDNGYNFLTQFEFIEEYGNKPFNYKTEGKIAISFLGHELCRGRGGARCMTLPILREKITG